MTSPVRSIILVRHAHAGDRSTATGPDYLRTLSERGQLQATQIAEVLAPAEPGYILSSRAARCISTMDPLARAVRREITEVASLFEGSDPRDAWAAIEDIVATSSGTIIACSHGDVIPGIIELLMERGLELESPPKIKKGSMTFLGLDGTEVRSLFVLHPTDGVISTPEDD